MALCPFAEHKLIAPGSNDPRIKPRVAILHVDAGDSFSLFSFFKFRSGGIESHFHIRKDGVIEQYRDTDFQADANRDANDFAVSIETQGFGSGYWNSKQLASIKRLLVWLSEVHDIPLKRVDRWDGSGVGHHTIWGAPSRWTPVAKSCPGPLRKRQFEKTIVPWFKDAAVGSVVTEEGVDDVKLTDKIARFSPDHKLKGTDSLSRVLSECRGYAERAYAHARAANARTLENRRDIEAILKALDGAHVCCAEKKDGA